MKRTRELAIVMFVLLHGRVAYTQPVIHFGEDSGVGNESRLASFPKSAAAQAAFLGALQLDFVEDFEELPNLTTPDMVLQFGSSTGLLSGYGTVWSQPIETYGGTYPISGNQYFLVDYLTSSFTVTLQQPVHAIGFFATDVGDFGTQISVILDGTREFLIPSTVSCPSDGVLFWGVISPDEPFVTMTLRPEHDFIDGWGIDDLTIGWVDGAVASKQSSWGALKSMYR